MNVIYATHGLSGKRLIILFRQDEENSTVNLPLEADALYRCRVLEAERNLSTESYYGKEIIDAREVETK